MLGKIFIVVNKYIPRDVPVCFMFFNLEVSMKISSTHWVIGKGPPPSPLCPGHLFKIYKDCFKDLCNIVNNKKLKKTWSVKIDDDIACHLVISGLIGPWQSASQMLLNLNKTVSMRQNSLEDDEQIGVEMKTNYHLGTVSSCRPKRSVTQRVEFSCSTEQNFLHLQ